MYAYGSSLIPPLFSWPCFPGSVASGALPSWIRAQGLLGQMWSDPPPQPQQAIRRDEDDRQEDEADERVETLGPDDVDGEGLHQDDDERPQERPDRMTHPADDGDDQDVDGGGDIDCARR